MNAQRHPPVLAEAISAHLLELDLLWEQRETQIFSDIWTLADLAEIEARADAHLDGLVLAGRSGRALAIEAIASGETGAVCAGALVLLASGDARPVLDALGTADAATAIGLRNALRHGRASWDESELRMVAAGGNPLAAACVADVLAFHRRHPALDLDRLVEADDPVLGRLVFAAQARARTPLPEAALRRGVASDDPEVRLGALRAAASSGTPNLARICRALIEARDESSPEAVLVLGSLGLAEDVSFVSELRADPTLALQATHALGSLGYATVVPALLESLSDAKLAPAASASFARIVGIEDLPRGTIAVPRESVDETEADFLPREDSIEEAAARALWQREGRRYQPDQRYQLGLPVPRRADASFHQLTLEIRRDLVLGARAQRDAGFADLEVEARAVLQRG